MINSLSDALDVFAEDLVEIRAVLMSNINDIINENRPFKKIKEDDKWTVENIRMHINALNVESNIAYMLSVVRRIDSRLQPPSKFKRITDDDIAKAKEYPLTELYDGRLSGRKKGVVLCPFLSEKTPSFTISEKNRFKCYGCGVYGTSIDYVMLRDNIKFIEAVKKLI